MQKDSRTYTDKNVQYWRKKKKYENKQDKNMENSDRTFRLLKPRITIAQAILIRGRKTRC